MISETVAAALMAWTFAWGLFLGAATVVDGRLPFGVRALLLLIAAAINFIAAISVAVWSVG